MKNTPAAPIPPQRLPDAFDWRQLGGCTPVTNQGGCGSCWAFAAIAVAESQYLIQSCLSLDLSEQWLISCTGVGSCDGGWYGGAFDSMTKVKDQCDVIGAPLEELYPYEAADDKPCVCTTGTPYPLTEWAALAEDPTSIKQAIMQHGPVAVAIAADEMFQCYIGGIFNADSGTEINHAVVLVGWDDTQGKDGIWFLRNSWGTGWGEGGYMRIEYGCNHVGTNPAWAKLSPENEPNEFTVPNPYPTIKAALAAAREGDIITLSPGIYSGPDNININPAGKEVTIRSINPSDPAIAAQTVIDCKGSGRAFIFENGETASMTIQGLTMKNGSLNDNGGAVYCYYSSPVFKQCIFENNRAGGTILKKNGGAIALYNSSPILTDCSILNNIATGSGGGISCRDSSSPVIVNCRILNNRAGLEGGGVFCWINSIAEIRNSVIAGNHADGFGGGIYFYEITAMSPSDPNIPSINFVTVAHNSTNSYGGGICLWDSKINLTNSILWNNTGLHGAGSQIAIIDDSLDETVLSVNYCDVKGSDQGHLLEPPGSPECRLDWGVGNFDADPLFADPVAGDYHLKSASGHWDPALRDWVLDDENNYDSLDDQNSPCIDAGDPSVPVTAEYQCNGGRVNIGAFGNTEQASRSHGQKCCMMCLPADFNCDCRINLADLVIIMEDWLECNYLPRHYCND